MDSSDEQRPGLKITTDEGVDVTEVVRQVYDMATGSMDYGSDFLSTEELGFLVELANILDASDKLEVAAKYRKKQFPEGFQASPHTYEPVVPNPTRHTPCQVCGSTATGFPYNHGLDVYPPEDRARVASQIEEQRARWTQFHTPQKRL